MKSTEETAPIGIVTVSFRSHPDLAELLQSIKTATTAPVDVVIVDNFPDGDPELASLAATHGARVVSRPDNPGYGGGINAGVRELSDSVEWFLIVNPDVTLSPGSIDVLRAAGRDGTIGALGPRIVNDSGETYPSARSIPSLRLGVGHALFGDIAPANPWTRAYHRHATYDSLRDAGWLSGACILVRRDAFDSVDGFDDGYFMYFEDVDLGFRLGAAGWRNLYVPAAVVEHEGGHSTKDRSAAMLAAHHRSARRWVQTRYPGAVWAPIRLAVRAGLWVRLILKTRNSAR